MPKPPPVPDVPNGTYRSAVSILKTLGFSLPAIRRTIFILAGTSQGEVAKKINVQPNLVTLYTAGTRKRPEIQVKIARLLQVPVAELFEDTKIEK